MMSFLALLFIYLTTARATAQTPLQTTIGYVVRVESGTVYLDFTDKNGAVPGRTFNIFTEGAEITHPVTGAILGRVEIPVGTGAIREVRPLYSVGTLSSSLSTIKPGMRSRLTPLLETTPNPSAPDKSASGNHPPRWRSAAFDFVAVAMAAADFTGEGHLTTAIADERSVTLYDYPPLPDKPRAHYTRPGIAPRIVSLESADLNGDGRAELFVSLYNDTFHRVETVVLELKDGQWQTLAEIPWLVHAYQDSTGKTALAVQQLVEDRTFPFSNIYPLTYNESKYTPGTQSIRPQRVDWLYDFTMANLNNKETSIVHLTNNDVLRLELKKGHWRSGESFGQTPNRLRWNNHLLEFHPAMPALYEGDKLSALYAVSNNAILGGLAQPFGLFSSGELHRLRWNDVSLEDEWKAEFGGYCPAMALVFPSGPAHQAEVAVIVVGSAGHSALWIYDP